ncbi:MAG: metallophosphoesterase [Thermoplasmata archaeon]|nr:metallophosphoesterase [Thermoplasmata archaeon]
MHEHLIRYFAENRRLVSPDALERLSSTPEPLLACRMVVERMPPEEMFVTLSIVETVLHPPAGSASAPTGRSSPGPGEPTRTGSVLSEGPLFSLISEGFAPGPGGRAPLEAYGSLFTARYRSLGRLLRGRPDLPNVTPIRDLRQRPGAASIVVMVREVRPLQRRRGLRLSVEDETGAAEVIVPDEIPASRVTWIPDEVVGIHVGVPTDLHRSVVAKSVVRPDVPTDRPRHRAGRPHRVLLLSDLHIGSRSFLDESWAGLLAFLRGQDVAPDVASEIRQVVIAGDLVDGIGIYPHQERDLAIGDIVEQYAELGRRLRELPAELEIVVVPGNHDAVCPAEPQPAIPTELTTSLPPNVRVLGNPSTFAMGGVVIEAYHGRSFDDLIPALPGASYSRPTEVMKTMLAMRHLAPIYGSRTPLAPLPRDGLVIDPVPDILVTGHSHTYGVDQYRGTLLVNASTWQGETGYQRMRNITPVPARSAIVDLTDLSVATLDFLSGRGKEIVLS